MKTYTYIVDPGHGWLSVSHKEILSLEIQDKISSYSYMDMTRVYLEEDCDMPLFLKTTQEALWDVSYKTSYRNRGPRHLASYNSYWIKKPLGVNSLVKVGHTVRQVTAITKNKIQLDNWWTMPKSNPFVYFSNPNY